MQALGSARRRDVCCRLAAFGLWVAFVAFFLCLAVHRGLMIPNDACHAMIAKCAACGIGYALWYQWHSLLGEIPVAASLLVGHWLLAGERFSRRSAFFAGLFLGLIWQANKQGVLRR